jgi:transcriptional regulator of arginine metabolism
MMETTDIRKTTGKEKRQTAIRNILNNKLGTTHEEIKKYLNEKGIKASQSTLSRDLREMGIIKIPANEGKACYRFSESIGQLNRIISNYPVNYEAIGNLIVIKTTSGSAPGFCVLLDRQQWVEIAGTIAGDDTILVVVRNPADAAIVVEKLEKWQNNNLDE